MYCQQNVLQVLKVLSTLRVMFILYTNNKNMFYYDSEQMLASKVFDIHMWGAFITLNADLICCIHL